MDSSHSINNKRKCTDVYVPIAWFTLLSSIILYCCIFSNLSILTKGRDDCGNICGELNSENKYDQCGPHDMRDSPNLLIQRQEDKTWIIQYKCVNQCPQNSTKNLIQCWSKEEFIKLPNFMTDHGRKLDGFTKLLIASWTGIAVCCAFTFLFSCIILILLRFIPQATIWIISILLTVLLFFASVLSTLSSFDAPSDGIASNLFLFVGFFVILMIIFRKKVVLAGKVFSETTKSMMKMIWIGLLPIVTFAILTIVFSAFIFTSLLIETSGTFTAGSSYDEKFQLNYKDTQIMKFFRILNILIFAWLGNFIINCQHFVVAGSVTKWYFTRDKSGMGGISKESVVNLVRFHLGSVCFGSIAVPVMRVINFGFRIVQSLKFAITSFFKGLKSQRVDHAFRTIDRILGTFSKSAYVLMENNKTQLFESGMKSYDLLLKNLGDVYWLNLFKDILLLLIQMFVPFFGILAGILIVESKSNEYTGISPATVNFTFTFLIAHCFFMTYGMAIDAILLCFCVDCKENDGDSKEYLMSKELKEVAMKIKWNCELEGNSGISDAEGSLRDIE